MKKYCLACRKGNGWIILAYDHNLSTKHNALLKLRFNPAEAVNLNDFIEKVARNVESYRNHTVKKLIFYSRHKAEKALEEVKAKMKDDCQIEVHTESEVLGNGCN